MDSVLQMRKEDNYAPAVGGGTPISDDDRYTFPILTIEMLIKYKIS